MTSALGYRVWAVPGGHIPSISHGSEPEFTSFDQLCILNTGDEPAQLEVELYYEDDEPVRSHPVIVAARRVRHVRLNDLIDPVAIHLGRPYGCVIRSTTPVVVQFTRQDTRVPTALAIASLMGFPAPGGSVTPTRS